MPFGALGSGISPIVYDDATRLPLRAKERRVSAAMRLQGRGNFCAHHELRQRLLSTSLVASDTPNA